MILFWVLSGIMLTVALLFTLPWLLRSNRQPDTDLDTVNTEVIKAQLAELEADLGSGRLDEKQYLAARQDLERELLADLSDSPADSDRIKVRSGRWAAPLLILLIPALTIGLYHYVGTRQIIPLLAQADTVMARQAMTPGNGTPSLEDLVERLAERMRQQPDDAKGWVMLARTYMALQRFSDAAVAYARAHRLAGDHADLLTGYADALVMANGGKFTDQAGALLLKALETEPDNVKALWLAGQWKNLQGEYTDAVRYWQRAAEQLPAEGDNALMLAQQIRQAREHLAPGTVVDAPAPRQDAAGTTNAAAGKAITVSISLDPQVAASAAPEDTVFIFARAVSGPRMPLAIVRKQVSDLPVTVTLDDSMAMAPGMKLSNFDAVAVGARISKSGTAMPQRGDLQGLVTPVVPGSGQAIELYIDSRIP